MPFVQRNTNGQIIGLVRTPQIGFDEELAMNHPDVLAFLHASGDAHEALLDLTQSDLAMVRVLEDLIEILMLKGALSMDELPEAARNKLEHRRELRGSLDEVLETFGGNKVI